MTKNNQFALLVSYFFSRCDKDALKWLGYSSFNQAANSIGKILKVNPNTIRNMRDEFDPYHNNSRIGWKRELVGSRLKVLKSFQDTDDKTLLEIVKEIILNKEFKNSEEYVDIQTIFEEKPKKNGRSVKEPVFILRGPTGKAAENFFIQYFNDTKRPVKGELADKRDAGCGYDFEIKGDRETYLVEVKGLSLETGGVLFTNKEWQTALENKNRYFLVLVQSISKNPKVVIINNPAEKLKAKRNIYTTVQLNWGVSGKDIERVIDNGAS